MRRDASYLCSSVFICGAFLHSQVDPNQLLKEVRTRVLDSVRRLPRYTCTETIDRSAYVPYRNSKLPCEEKQFKQTLLMSTDRVRLDVAVGEHREMFSWPGSREFASEDLGAIVKDGATSTGSFATILPELFGEGIAVIEPIGPRGNSLYGFRFRIPKEKSAYLYKNGDVEARAGQQGTFLVNTKTSDLERLDLTSDPLPHETQACLTDTTLTYRRMRLQDAEFLLPTEARLQIFHTNGAESINRTRFSNCHEFLGETSIRFDTPDDHGNAPKGDAAPAAVEIPAGIGFRAITTDEIRLDKSAAGDRVEGKLLTPLAAIAPAGTRVTFRVVRIRESFERSSDNLALLLRVESVEIGGALQRVTAKPNLDVKFHAKGKTEPTYIGHVDTLEERAAGYMFRVTGPSVKFRGLESNWVTVNP